MSTATDREKTLLRRQLLQKMNSVSRDEIVRASSVIERKVLEYVDRQGIKSVFIYLSFGNEIITDGIIEGLFKRNIKVSVPIIEGPEMKSVIYEAGDRLVLNPFGIREPVRRCYADDAELCLVPGIAFDRSLMRLGHGRGYYDRYLQGRRCMKIGLFGSWQEYEKLPANQYDVVLDAIFTENYTI